MTPPPSKEHEVAIYLHECSMENVKCVDDGRDLHATKPSWVETRYLVRRAHRRLLTSQLRRSMEGFAHPGGPLFTFREPLSLLYPRCTDDHKEKSLSIR